jgi:hypothetical protein
MNRRVATYGRSRMEVAVVLCVLAALGIGLSWWTRSRPKVRTSAKTLQAMDQMNKMWRGSLTYYETDHFDALGKLLPRQFPGPAAAVEGTAACGCIRGGCPGGSPVYESDPVWRALGFSLPNAHDFMPAYESSGVGTSARFTLYSRGDTNCNGVFAEFSRTGYVDGDGKVTGSWLPVIKNELE